MRKIFLFNTFIICSLLFTNNNVSAETMPINGYGKNIKINVPPPVLRAYQALLLEIAQDHNISFENIIYGNTVWEKDKNTYTVYAEFGSGDCDDEAPSFTVKAMFKANGDIIYIKDFKGKLVKYHITFINCIRLPI